MGTNPSRPPKSSYNSANMSPIKEAMELLKATFKDYAGLDGDKETLTKAEIRVLLRCELTGGSTTEEDVDDLLRKLDTDKDDAVTFREFVKIATDMKLMYY